MNMSFFNSKKVQKSGVPTIGFVKANAKTEINHHDYSVNNHAGDCFFSKVHKTRTLKPKSSLEWLSTKSVRLKSKKFVSKRFTRFQNVCRAIRWSTFLFLRPSARPDRTAERKSPVLTMRDIPFARTTRQRRGSVLSIYNYTTGIPVCTARFDWLNFSADGFSRRRFPIF